MSGFKNYIHCAYYKSRNRLFYFILFNSFFFLSLSFCVGSFFLAPSGLPVFAFVLFCLFASRYVSFIGRVCAVCTVFILLQMNQMCMPYHYCSIVFLFILPHSDSKSLLLVALHMQFIIRQTDTLYSSYMYVYRIILYWNKWPNGCELFFSFSQHCGYMPMANAFEEIRLPLFSLRSVSFPFLYAHIVSVVIRVLFLFAAAPWITVLHADLYWSSQTTN